MGISIKGKGGGARVTIDGKPITEKIELTLIRKEDEKTKKYFDVDTYHIFLRNDKCSYITKNSSSNEIHVGKYDLKTNSFKKIQSLFNRYNRTPSSTQIGNILYTQIPDGKLEKINLDTETVTEINASAFSCCFEFNGEVYFLKSYKNLYKYNEKDNSETYVSGLSDAPVWTDEWIPLYLDDCVYLLPHNARGSNGSFGTAFYKYDGSKLTLIELPKQYFGFENGVFGDISYYRNAPYFYDTYGMPDYNKAKFYTINKEDNSFTYIKDFLSRGYYKLNGEEYLSNNHPVSYINETEKFISKLKDTYEVKNSTKEFK